MIVVIDYGINNSSSVARMIQKVGSVKIATFPEDLDGASKIVLPGVGHFDENKTS